MGIGIAADVMENIEIPLDRECGIIPQTVLDAKPFNVQEGMHDASLVPEKTVCCWEFHHCDEVDCPAHGSEDPRRWIQSGLTAAMALKWISKIRPKCAVGVR